MWPEHGNTGETCILRTCTRCRHILYRQARRCMRGRCTSRGKYDSARTRYRHNLYHRAAQIKSRQRAAVISRLFSEKQKCPTNKKKTVIWFTYRYIRFSIYHIATNTASSWCRCCCCSALLRTYVPQNYRVSKICHFWNL